MNDRDAIERAALDYYEGWFEGDAARMERALHPGLAKRCIVHSEDGTEELNHTSAKEMIDATAEGIGRSRDVPDRGIRVEIDHVYGDIASVTVLSHVYGAEYVHVARTEEGWKIVNVLWTPREA